MRLDATGIDVSSMDGLRQKTPVELKADLKTLRDGVVQIRFQKVYGQLEDMTQGRKTRQNIARVMTILREKQVQQFLLSDPEIRQLLEDGKVSLSVGKNDPKGSVSRDDLSGNDARSHTLVMRLWSQLRRDPDFHQRTRHIETV